MMKSLQAFWKLFKRKKRTTETERRKKPDIGEKVRSDFLAENRELPEKPPPILRKKKEKVYIQVGLDFGTSATKIVFSQLGRRYFRALCFDHNLPNYPSYCIPSVCSFDKDGKLLLGIEAAKSLLDKEWDIGLQRLKVVLAGKHDSSFRDLKTDKKYYDYQKEYQKPIIPERIVAIFVAYAMNKSRLIIQNLSEYNGVDLDFAFNIGMPIDHEENNKVKPVFEGVFAWAEAIENEWLKSKHSIDPLEVSYLVENHREQKGTKVYAVPEAVASFASYLVSLRKKAGLHAVIDFGSGTTDVSICNLLMHSDDSKCFWYAAKNIPRGTINIERIIASHIREDQGRGFCTSNDICLTLNGFKNSLRKPNSFEKDSDINSAVWNELTNLINSSEYKRTWGLAYSHLKKDVLWKNVEVFTCGGGSNLPQIKNIFSKPWWVNLKTVYPVTKLPVPDNYDPGRCKAPFERMSVAYGLAIPLPQIGDYDLPSGSPDHTPPPLPVLEIDHEELYTG